MELYETDRSVLEKFIASEKVEGEITEEYLILYNFATDCMYASDIDPQLLGYLLPFYRKVIEQAVLYGEKNTSDIYCEFNSAVFSNKKSIRAALGEAVYHELMQYYIEQTLKSMEQKQGGILDWVSVFNTTVAFESANILQLFKQISEGSIKVKYAFFRYLSVLLFKESDNLLASEETRDFWSSDIWDYDGYFNFSWNDEAVAFYDREISREWIEALFTEITPLLCEVYGEQMMELVREEMDKSFASGTFLKRKAEFLNKISCKGKEYLYWYETF